MTTPPKVVKLGASQVRQPPRMKNQVQNVEDVIKRSVIERKSNEPITEDKKAEKKKDEKITTDKTAKPKNDEKKSPTGKKVKMRKRRQREKEDALSDQLRE